MAKNLNTVPRHEFSERVLSVFEMSEWQEFNAAVGHDITIDISDFLIVTH
jgi:hypothetical protein